jgi:hypothetical protein
MTSYKSKSGKTSGVTAYEIGEDYIKVEFNKKKIYKYTYPLNNPAIIDNMKSMALQQEGLSTFISRNRDLKFV